MQDAMMDESRLQLIESMIKKARNDYNESGSLYLMWGFVILFCSITQFVAMYFFQKDLGYIWMLTWLAVIVQIVVLRKEKKKKKATSYTDEIIGYIWISFFVCMMMLVFILIYNKSYTAIPPAILVMYGLPTFLCGTIIRFNILKYGGLCCWPLAIACTFSDPKYQLLYISAAVVLAWILPGIYLRKKYKREKHER